MRLVTFGDCSPKHDDPCSIERGFFMNETQLRECCDDWSRSVTVDTERRCVRDVALTGIHSKNGYRYSESVLQNAIPLYNEKPVFLDHATDRTRPHERSTRDLVGTVENARFEEGRIRGDIRVLDTDSGRTFFELVEADSPGVGMSHVVIAERSQSGTEVIRIKNVLSVDAVINPATTTTFHEATSPCLKCDTTATLLDEKLAAMTAERDNLLHEIATLKSSFETLDREHEVQLLLHESALPAEAISETFLGQLQQADSSEQRHQLIQDRMTLISNQPARPAPIASHARRNVPAASNDDFVRAVRSR